MLRGSLFHLLESPVMISGWYPGILGQTSPRESVSPTLTPYTTALLRSRAELTGIGIGIKRASTESRTAEERCLTVKTLHLLFDGLVLIVFSLFILALTILVASGLDVLLGY